MKYNFFIFLFFLFFLIKIFFVALCPASAQEDEDAYLDFGEDAGLTVVGTKKTTQQIDVVKREDIEKSNAPDMTTLLEDVLDIGSTRYGAYGNQSSINLRGFDSERVAILLDGIPLNSAMDGDFNINTIDLNSVERIEVIYGGSDSKYNVSGALGGVINIVTVKENKKGFSIGAGLSNTSYLPGSYKNIDGQTEKARGEDLLDTQNYSVRAGYGAENFSFSANGFVNSAKNHFLYKDYYGTIRRKQHNEIVDGGANTNFIFKLPDNITKLITNAGIYYGDLFVPRAGNSTLYGEQHNITNRESIMLDAPLVTDNIATEASLSYNFSRLDFNDAANAFSRHDLQNFMVINRWSFYHLKKITFRSGFDYRLNTINSSDIGRSTRHDSGVYITAEMKPAQQFMLIPSVKLIGDGKALVPVPKLGLSFSPQDSWTIKNNYFRSFKFPDFEDLYWQGAGMSGNPDLKPEDGWGVDLGVEYRYTAKFGAESTFFYQQTSDSIHWAQAGTTWKPQNVGEAAFFGWSAKLHFELPLSAGAVKKIIFSPSYQMLLSYLLSYGYTWSDKKRIPYMPMHTAGGSVEIPWESAAGKKGSLSISGHYESLRYGDTANITKLKSYMLLSATLNQQLHNNFSMFAACRNILNSSYQSLYDYPMPGISISLGIRFKRQ
jgi:vitamin B12 transporter